MTDSRIRGYPSGRDRRGGWGSEPLDVFEDEEGGDGEHGGAHHHPEEGMGQPGDADVDVHAVEAGNERGHHQHDRDGRHALHDLIHVVGDDRGIGVHRAGQYFGVDVGGVLGLANLDLHILEQVAVGHIGEDMAETLDEHLVALQRRAEVDQRLLQAHKSQQVRVLHRPLELLRRFLHPRVDNLQKLQKPEGRRIDDAQHKVALTGDGNLPAAPVDDEVVDNLVGVVADGDGDVGTGDDGDGDSVDGRVGGLGARGNTHNGEHPLAVALDARPLVDVVGVGQDEIGDMERLSQKGKVVIVRTFHTDPAAGLPDIRFLEGLFCDDILPHSTLETPSPAQRFTPPPLLTQSAPQEAVPAGHKDVRFYFSERAGYLISTFSDFEAMRRM